MMAFDHHPTHSMLLCTTAIDVDWTEVARAWDALVSRVCESLSPTKPLTTKPSTQCAMEAMAMAKMAEHDCDAVDSDQSTTDDESESESDSDESLCTSLAEYASECDDDYELDDDVVPMLEDNGVVDSDDEIEDEYDSDEEVVPMMEDDGVYDLVDELVATDDGGVGGGVLPPVVAALGAVAHWATDAIAAVIGRCWSAVVKWLVEGEPQDEGEEEEEGDDDSDTESLVPMMESDGEFDSDDEVDEDEE